MFDIYQFQKNFEEKRLVLGKKFEKFLLQKFSQSLAFCSAALARKEAAFFGCFLIVALSIFLRSTRDIGHDSATYIEVASKMLKGGKYYQDFFEMNFPLSFLLTIIPVFLAKTFSINPIFTLDIFVNLVGIFSIIFSEKILQRSEIAKQGAFLNLIIFTFAAAFFLRVFTLQFNDFATKTTYFLALVFPYFSYHLIDDSRLNRFDQIIIGSLAALIICLKPNYGILIFIFELEKLFRRGFRSSFCLRNYVSLAILFSYILLIVFCFPEYVKNFSITSKSYYAAASSLIPFIIKEDVFLLLLFASLSCFLLKKNHFLLQFYLLSFAAILIVISELIGGYDQRFIIYSLSLPLLATSLFLLIKNNYFDFRRYGILLIFILVLTQFDAKNIFNLAFNIGAFWFLFVLVLAPKFESNSVMSKIFLPKNISSWPYFILSTIGLISLSLIKEMAFLAWIISAIIFLLMINFYQKLHEKKFSTEKLSSLSACAISIVVAYFIALHLAAISNSQMHHQAFQYKSPNHLNAEMIKTARLYLAQDEKVAIVAELIPLTYPAITYMGKTNELPFFQAPILFKKISENTDAIEAEDYLFSRIKQQLADKKNKLFFVEIENDVFGNKCQIGFLEYYFRDAEFRKIFSENYRFLNRIIDRESVEKKVDFFANDVDLEFGEMTRIARDVEVYVRK